MLVFCLPFISVSIFGLGVDIYCLVFFACTSGFLWYYRKASALKIRASLKSGWALGLILAIFVGMGFISLSLTNASVTAHSYRDIGIATVLWRGTIFGLLNGILISAFPFIVVWRALAGSNPGNMRKIGVVLAATLSILFMSLSYHIGLIGFDRNGIEKGVKLYALAAIPTLLSGNPLASPIAGAFLHMSETIKSSNEMSDSGEIQSADVESRTGDIN